MCKFSSRFFLTLSTTGDALVNLLRSTYTKCIVLQIVINCRDIVCYACDLVSFVCLPRLNMKCCRNRLLRNDHSDSRQKNGAIAEIEQMVNSSAHKQNGNAVEMLHKITIQHEYMFINDFRCYFFSCLFFCVECVCFSFHRHIYNTFPLNGRA